MIHAFITIDEVVTETEKLSHLLREHEEQRFAEIIKKYDFMVGSKECKHRLMEVLPKEAKIICSPYIESSTIYAIKKFDVMDLLTEPYKETKDENRV